MAASLLEPRLGVVVALSLCLAAAVGAPPPPTAAAALRGTPSRLTNSGQGLVVPLRIVVGKGCASHISLQRDNSTKLLRLIYSSKEVRFLRLPAILMRPILLPDSLPGVVIALNPFQLFLLS